MDGAAGSGFDQEAKGPVGIGRVIPEDHWGILCIYAESRGEPFDGQVAVGNVIRKRTRIKFFSDGTVASTVTWPFQFSWMNHNDGQRTRVLKARWEDPAISEAARAWYESNLRDASGGATHYHADYVRPEWAKANHMRFLHRIGRHLFYVETRP